MDLSTLLFFFIVIIPSSIIHEFSHGWMANQLGDPTAKYAGRLTLNPLVHIDLWGTILMPLILFFASGGSFMFAYAKPVPFNPFNLKYPKWGPAFVALAGPASNLITAFVFAMLLRFIGAGYAPWGASIGSAGSFLTALAGFFSIIVYANILLAVFNLVPIPPLDGSKVLYALLPDRLVYRVAGTLERYGFIVLLLFVFFAFQLIQPVIFWVYRVMVGI